MRERLRAWSTPRTRLLIGFGGAAGFLYAADLAAGHWTSALFLIVHATLLAFGYSAVATVAERKFGPHGPERSAPAANSASPRLFRPGRDGPGLRERLRAWLNPASSTTRWKVLRGLVGYPLYLAAFAIGVERPAGLAAVAAGAAVVVTTAVKEENARREENGDPPEIIMGDWRRALNGNLRDVFRRGDRDA